MAKDLTIAKPLPFASTMGSSFDLELRGLLWSRVMLVTLVALGVCILVLLINIFLIEHARVVFDFKTLSPEQALYGHTGSFLLTLPALLLMRRFLCHHKLMLLAFLLFTFNVCLAIFGKAVCHPADQAFFEIALLIFLPAALVPWRIGFQIGLAVIAVLAMVGSELYFLAKVDDYAVFWSEQGGLNAFIDHVIWGVTGTAILGAVSVIASRTLYSLRKTVHQAQRLGNYVIEKELGRGGMGTVYLARHALICRPTAVKVMEAPTGEAQSALVRFEQEVRLSANLTHPNTINIFDYGRSTSNIFYYAMEYLDGLDLQGLVEKYGPLRPERAVHVLRQVCGSLGEAHQHSIVHRDVKPSNIFLTQRGGIFDFVKVLDFGLAKRVATGDASLTQAGMLFGTPRYMAPEAAADGEANDARSDLYNLGGVAYWLLTGQPPFTSDSSLELIADHIKTIPLRPSEVTESEIPPMLEDIIMKCLAKKPEDRYQSTAELSDALEAIAFTEPWTDNKARQWWELHGLLTDEMAVRRESIPS